MAAMTVRSLDEALKRRSSADSRAPSPRGVGPGKNRRIGTGANNRQEPAPKAGRRHRQPRYILTKPRVVYRMPKGMSP